jgi:mRNA interferase RelE/StbE
LAYEISIKNTAIDDLQKIDKTQASRIILTAINKLSKNPQQFDSLIHQFIGYRRLRVGDYRVIFAIEDDKNRVVIIRVGHRKEIYDR